MSNLFFTLFLLAIVLFFILWLADCATQRSEVSLGQVIQRVYKPEINSSGVGFGSNGHSQYQTQHESEKFLCLVQPYGGDVISLDVEPNLWAMLNPGDGVRYEVFTGRVLHLIWSKKVLDRTSIGMKPLSGAP